MTSPTRPRRLQIARLSGAVVIGLALGVSADVLRVGGLDAWLAARGPAVVPTQPPYDPRGRLLSVDGRNVYLDCRGSGGPTVLLEAGFASGAAGWGETIDGIAAFTRVCAWDRPGLGRSDPRGVHSPAETAADLRAALAAAGERGPYVVVAHSFGGVYARILAEGPGARGDVLGLLLLDTYDPDLGMVDDPVIPTPIRDEIRANLDATAAMLAAGEQLDWSRTLQELAVAGPLDLPAIRITLDPRSRWVDPDPAVVELLIDAWRRAVARTFPEARSEVATGSGHLIQFDRPDLVIARTRELVDAARPAQRSP